VHVVLLDAHDSFDCDCRGYTVHVDAAPKPTSPSAAADLLAAQPADEALRALTERFADYIATKRSMGNALRSAAASDSPLFAQTRERILGALRLLLDAGAASGTLRSDVDPKDVIRIINGIWHLPNGPQWREDVGRMLELVIDGLRYGVPESGQRPAR
jgi:hypothetical protein